MDTTPPPHFPSTSLYSTPTPPSRPAPPPGRRGGGLIAGVVAAALVAGGGAGFGGAALWDAVSDTPSASAAPASAPTLAAKPRPAAEGSIEAVAAKVLPSVVRIDVRGAQGAGSGSGIVLSEDGSILTNHHVVAAAGDDGAVRVSFADGETAEADVLGVDPLTDTAVIKAREVSGLRPATIGNSEDLTVGQQVVAIGSPFGLDATVTSGIVSALGRPVSVGTDDQGNSTTYPAVQTDAAINPGNSGGPLVDMSGAVIGINSSIRTASAGSPAGGGAGSIGLGFAIPIQPVMPIVEQMEAGETPTHARLGIRISDAADATGAQVREVTEGSTAADAGLRTGDVVTRVGSHHISGADSLVATIRTFRPGDTVEVRWTRAGQERSATIELDSDASGD